MTAKTALGNAGFYLLGFFLPSTLLSSQLITSHVTSGTQMGHRQQKGQELLQASDDLIKARWDTCSRQKQAILCGCKCYQAGRLRHLLLGKAACSGERFVPRAGTPVDHLCHLGYSTESLCSSVGGTGATHRTDRFMLVKQLANVLGTLGGMKYRNTFE